MYGSARVACAHIAKLAVCRAWVTCVFGAAAFAVTGVCAIAEDPVITCRARFLVGPGCLSGVNVAKPTLVIGMKGAVGIAGAFQEAHGRLDFVNTPSFFAQIVCAVESIVFAHAPVADGDASVAAGIDS